MKHEDQEKGKAELGAGSVQRSTGSESKAAILKEITAIRQGHATGGYCDTEALKVEEQKLHGILEAEVNAEEKKQPRDDFRIRSIKREIAALAYKPRLVVAADQTL